MNLLQEHAVPIKTRTYPRVIGYVHASPAEKPANGKPPRQFSCHLLAYVRMKGDYPNGIVIDGNLIDARTIQSTPIRRRPGPSTSATRYANERRGSQQFAYHSGSANRSPVETAC